MRIPSLIGMFPEFGKISASVDRFAETHERMVTSPQIHSLEMNWVELKLHVLARFDLFEAGRIDSREGPDRHFIEPSRRGEER